MLAVTTELMDSGHGLVRGSAGLARVLQRDGGHNVSSSYPSQAAELMSSWANLRRKHTGVDEPHNVKYWGLGNESECYTRGRRARELT